MSKDFLKIANNMEGFKDEADPEQPGEDSVFESDELAFLRLVTQNSKHSIRPTKVPLICGGQSPNLRSPLLVATISTSLLFKSDASDKFKGFNHFKPISRSNDRYSLFALTDVLSVEDMKVFLRKAIIDTGKALKRFEAKHLKKKQQEAANRIIVINEFGFPFPLEAAERSAFLLKLEQEMNDDPTMRTFWLGCYVVFGSYHCHNEMKNSAVISLPYAPAEPEEPDENNPRNRSGGPLHPYDAYKEITKREIGNPGLARKGRRFNFTQDKFSPAEKIGERLVPRNKIDWAYYDTDMGRIGVLICFDALDPRMLLRLATYQINDTNSDMDGFSAIIVPSFSSNDQVRKACGSISKILKTLVVYVNVQYADKGKDVIDPPSSSSARPSGHAYFYRGKEIFPSTNDDGIVTGPIEKPVVADEKKNLWYSTRFCYLDREQLALSAMGAAGFSDSFRSIFSPSTP